jgi:hypothetical protein
MITKMSKMNEDKASIRPAIKNTGSMENKNPAERFQNITLRPVIKLQHELLIAFFQNYLKKKKIDFSGLSELQKNEVISKAFKNDNLFKTEIRGLVIGHFTLEEYNTYQTIAVDSNKRIMAMIEQRLQSVTL